MAIVNTDRITLLASYIKDLPIDRPLNFYSFTDKKTGIEHIAADAYPPLGHVRATDFFGFMVMHQYGFWNDDGVRYTAPLYGTINGRSNVKGSDLLNMACMNAFNKDPWIFEPYNLMQLSDTEYANIIFADDNGTIPFADIDDRIKMSRAYGRHMDYAYRDMGMLLAIANNSSAPLARFRELMSHVPGYNEDPFEKKNLLLAMAMVNRPEQFLDAKLDDPAWIPVVDYHLMRLGLRTGMVTLTPEERAKNITRNLVSIEEEREIRSKTFDAFSALIKESGRTMSEIDNLFWSGRRYCPEDKQIQCDPCVFNTVCVKETALFQPVRRTRDY